MKPETGKIENKQVGEKESSSIESLVLAKKKNLEQAEYEYAEAMEKQVTRERTTVIEKDFFKLRHVPAGLDDYASSEVFSKNAIYDVLNLRTGISTVFNGLQMESLFGMDDDARKRFARQEVDIPTYRTQKLVARFRYFERK